MGKAGRRYVARPHVSCRRPCDAGASGRSVRLILAAKNGESPSNVKTGRNDPCPCGSGRKYKKCCLPEDEGLEVAVPKGNARPPGLSPGAPSISPYALARMVEQAATDKRIELSRKVRRAIRDGWTISKLASMTTEAIEDKVRSLGIPHTRERFARLAEGRESAWSVGQTWIALGRAGHGNDDIDFLCLAACELWKRLLPDRPSVEMIDDWMQEGYEHDMAGRHGDATEIWWKVWQTLRARFPPGVRTMSAADAVFSGTQLIFNWCQDFELALENAVIDSPGLAGLGKRYCSEWLTQFPDEDGEVQVGFRRTLAGFQFCLGETSAGEATLHGIVERWPEDVWGYVALADAYGRFRPREPGPERDVARALGYLERGLAITGTQRDRDVLVERREALLGMGAE